MASSPPPTLFLLPLVSTTFNFVLKLLVITSNTFYLLRHLCFTSFLKDNFRHLLTYSNVSELNIPFIPLAP